MERAESLLDELDASWQANIVPDLPAILATIPENLPLRAELCAADLEWRWRKNEMRNRRLHATNTTFLSDHPSAVDYRDLLGADGDNPSVQSRLNEAEWIARNAWGDRPRIDDFLQENRLPATVEASLLAKLDWVESVTLLVSRKHQSLLQTKIPPDFLIGRQASHEPPPVAWDEQETRLIVIERANRSFSRSQLRVRRTRVRELELINLSSKIDVTIKDTILKPTQGLHVSLPFHWELANLSLHFVADAFVF